MIPFISPMSISVSSVGTVALESDAVGQFVGKTSTSPNLMKANTGCSNDGDGCGGSNSGCTNAGC
jgi:hypothetical protein